MKYNRLINNNIDFKYVFILSIILFFGLCTLGNNVVEIKGTMSAYVCPDNAPNEVSGVCCPDGYTSSVSGGYCYNSNYSNGRCNKIEYIYKLNYAQKGIYENSGYTCKLQPPYKYLYYCYKYVEDNISNCRVSSSSKVTESNCIEAGQYQNSSTSCADCGIGYYCPYGSTERKACGKNMTTDTTTASSFEQCRCITGYVKDLSGYNCINGTLNNTSGEVGGDEIEEEKSCSDYGLFDKLELAEQYCESQNRNADPKTDTSKGIACYSSSCGGCLNDFHDEGGSCVPNTSEENNETDNETGDSPNNGDTEQPNNTGNDGSKPCYVCPTSSNSWEFSRNNITTQWGNCWYFSNSVSCSGKYTPPVSGDDIDNDNNNDNTENDGDNSDEPPVDDDQDTNNNTDDDKESESSSSSSSSLSSSSSSSSSDEENKPNSNVESSSSSNVSSNPSTGNIVTFVVLVLGITMLGYVVYYYSVLKDY